MAVNGIEIKAGQVWRTRDDELASVSASGNEIYPWRAKYIGNAASWTVDDSGARTTGEDDPLDLVELVKDENGFTIWRGGEQPAETIGKIVEYELRTGEGDVGLAAALHWPHIYDCSDITAYKVIEADATVGIDLGVDGGERNVVSVEIPPGYNKLFDVLMQALNQAAGGKGKERHARAGVAFEDQPMSTINKQLGSIDGLIYQAHKKSLESKRLPDGRAQAELLGAMNYLAGAVIALDTWAKKAE